jgi:hypothetical protein
MREWNLKKGDPLSLTISADARLSQTDYCNDQIWELSLGGGEPQALAMHTTFGLRARSLRLFPRFTEGNDTVSDPSAFSTPPSIRHFYPNFLTVSFYPFSELEVKAEYWVPLSQAVAGRLRITNHSSQTRNIRLDWVAILTIAGEGERMAAVEIEATQVLAGKSSDLAPVVFLTGGPQAGTAPYPALTMNLELEAKQERLLTWTQAALADWPSSLTLARQIAARNWEAELARIELLYASQVEVHTGDSDWDAAFSLSQKVAYGLFLQPTANLQFPSFVLTRQPDQGYSLRGTGGDYDYLWNGQTPLDTYYMCSLILPAAVEFTQGLLHNFVCSAKEDGFIDWKPGLGGQRSQLLATPLLASLAWKIYQSSQDASFIEAVYPPLLEFVRLWFTNKHDRDGDGIPEWDHIMQAGFDDHPLFTSWMDWSQGAEISTAESPGLCAMLYNECQALIQMAGLLQQPEAIPGLLAVSDNLRTAIEISWEPSQSIYQYWDRDSHYCTRGEVLGHRRGDGEVILDRQFNHAVRMLMQVQVADEVTRRIRVFIHGTTPNGQHIVEPIPYNHWKWQFEKANATGERIYTHVERVVVEGLEEGDLFLVKNVSYDGEDNSLLLPLWAKIPAEERVRALVEGTLTDPDRFWGAYGIPTTSVPPFFQKMGASTHIHMPWNLLLGEGLLAYGYRKEAADLVARLMKSVIQTLKQNQSFRKYYHPDTGSGTGDPNSLDGLAPLSLFLDCLGVKLHSHKSVSLSGINPFPWPVTVKYRGLTVLRQIEKTTVIFPNGETVTVTDPSPCTISLDSSER